MATIVAAYGLPHTPILPFKVADEGPSSVTGRLFGMARNSLAAARPDVVVIFDTDHLNTFFLDNLPVFAIGVDDTFTGPSDEPRGVTVKTIPSHQKLAAHIRKHAVHAGFDLALVQDFAVDHSVYVPLHFVDARTEHPGHPHLHPGTGRPCPRRSAASTSAAEVRKAIEAVARAAARRGDRNRQLLARSVRAAHRNRAATTAFQIRTGSTKSAITCGMANRAADHESD